MIGTTLVGRERELGELRAAFDDAVDGNGRLVIVVGEPGIGKTRTAEELATYATRQGAWVLWSRCYEDVGVAVPIYVTGRRD